MIEGEKKLTQSALKRFEELVGNHPSEEDYLDVVEKIQEFYVRCHSAHEHYDTGLKVKFDGEPQEQARRAMGYYRKLKESLQKEDEIQLLQLFSQRPLEELQSIMDGLTRVESFAAELGERHRNMLGDVEQVDSLILEAAREKLERLSKRIEEMEVAE